MTLSAIGITCGVGSMLIGPKQLGYDIIGNIEWRKYYHQKDEQGRNTFTQNFPGAMFVESIDQLSRDDRTEMRDATLAMSHPECGAFSNLRAVKTISQDCMDIPLACNLITRLRPRFFALDELPKAMVPMPAVKWAELLPDYDLFFEWVSNYHYGNIQKNRRRMFIVGARKEERWTFIPGEEPNTDTLADVLDIPDDAPNHDPVWDPDDVDTPFGRNVRFFGDRMTFREFREYMAAGRANQTLQYYKPDGTLGSRLGLYKMNAKADYSGLMTGGASVLHPEGRVLTLRERARIQGTPDDFVFYGTKYEGNGSFNPFKNSHMLRQTGKFMPVQFCRYMAKQVKATVRGKRFEASGKRFLNPNPYVDQAKMDYCREVGYDRTQVRACKQCWLTETCEMARAKNPEWRGV